MEINFIIAQIFGFLCIVFNVLSMQMKRRRNIIFMLLCLSLFAALNFIFLGQFAGSYVSLFAILETAINYLFEKKQKPVPVYIVVFYIIANIILGLLSFNSLLDIIPIIAAIVFCLAILNKKESGIRKFMLLNQILWLFYDFSSGAYSLCISNILAIVSTVIALYRFDGRKKKAKS